MDYIFIADEALIEDDVDMYVEICEICEEVDNFN